MNKVTPMTSEVCRTTQKG